MTAFSGTVTTPFGFAGQYTDAVTGLQYLRARYYDPATMQFLSRDPLVDQTGQPYAYAAADPLNNTDPAGLFCIPFVTPGGCRLPTWSEARQEGYGTAVSASAVLDSLTFGGFSHLASWAGAGVDTCSVDYQNGEKAALPITMLLAVGSFGGDIAADANLGRAVGQGAEEYVNLASEARTTHILYGDATGGGHLWPGMPGKTPFPADWSAAKVMHVISDVATDPASSVVRQGSKLLVSGTREGVDITVVIGRNGDIRTGFLTNLPRNP